MSWDEPKNPNNVQPVRYPFGFSGLKEPPSSKAKSDIMDAQKRAIKSMARKVYHARKRVERGTEHPGDREMVKEWDKLQEETK